MAFRRDDVSDIGRTPDPLLLTFSGCPGDPIRVSTSGRGHNTFFYPHTKREKNATRVQLEKFHPTTFSYCAFNRKNNFIHALKRNKYSFIFVTAGKYSIVEAEQKPHLASDRVRNRFIFAHLFHTTHCLAIKITRKVKNFLSHLLQIAMYLDSLEWTQTQTYHINKKKKKKNHVSPSDVDSECRIGSSYKYI